MTGYFLKYFLAVLFISRLASSEDLKILTKCSFHYGHAFGGQHLLPYEEVPSEVKRLIYAEKPELEEFDFVCATEQILKDNIYRLEFVKSKDKCIATVDGVNKAVVKCTQVL